MIRDELNTGLRWYNDIEKQSRYKAECAAVCEYKRLTPLNSILPFQILTGDTSFTIDHWYIYCESNDAATIDLTSSIASKLVQNTNDGKTYITYLGAAIGSLTLPCGNYYSVIETSESTFYSEVFTCQDITDTAFSQIQFPLFTAWRWYNNVLKQNRYKKQCEAVCDRYLLSGNDALLPFMFRKLYAGIPPEDEVVDSWILRNLDGDCITLLDTSLIHITQITEYDPYTYHYIYYLGEALAGLPCGIYESVLTISGVSYYSEPIEITNAISTNVDSDYLLQETSDRLLQETGFGILLE